MYDLYVGKAMHQDRKERFLREAERSRLARLVRIGRKRRKDNTTTAA